MIFSMSCFHGFLSLLPTELLEEASVGVTMGPPVEEVYTSVGGVPTYLLKCGKIQKEKPLVLIIPGNILHVIQFMYTLCMTKIALAQKGK